MREKSNFDEIKEIFNSDDCKLDDTNLLLSSVRENVYELRKQLAIDAFHLRDWLDASECGGIKAEPKFVNYEAKHCDKYSYIKLNYHYNELCGYMDSPYHTGYSSDDIYSDIYKIEDNSDTGVNIICVAGHESSGSIGADSVFKRKIDMQQSDGTFVTKFTMFDDAKPKVDELLNKYQTEMNFVMMRQDTFDKVFNNTQKFFANHPETEVADHGFNHAVRVYNKAMKICDFEDELPFSNEYDRLTVICAALLHDVDDHKFFNTKDYDNAREIMQQSGVDKKTIENVIDCISQVSFSKNGYNKPNSFEAGAVRDSDRLEGMGAFGIMRTFITGATMGRPVEGSIRHCSEKILHLHKHMCTSGGSYLAKEIAKHGEDFMIALGKEYALSDNIKSYGNNAIQVADNIVTRYEIRKAQMETMQKDITVQVVKSEATNMKQSLMAKIHKNGCTLESASDELKNDKDVVLAAVKQNGYSVKYASDELKNDKDVALAAVSQNGNSIRYLSEYMRSDKDVAKAAIMQNESASKFVPKKIIDTFDAAASNIKNPDEEITKK